MDSNIRAALRGMADEEIVDYLAERTGKVVKLLEPVEQIPWGLPAYAQEVIVEIRRPSIYQSANHVLRGQMVMGVTTRVNERDLLSLDICEQLVSPLLSRREWAEALVAAGE